MLPGTQGVIQCLRLNVLLKGDPSQGPRVSSCLILESELSKETHRLTKQETLLRRATWVESSRVREPRGLFCHVAHCLGFCGDAISFRAVSGRSFWLRVLPSGSHVAQSRWIPARRILGRHMDSHLLSPSNLSTRILLVGGNLLVPCSLPGSPVIK